MGIVTVVNVYLQQVDLREIKMIITFCRKDRN